MKSISILGSTGSIGVQTLEVIAQYPTKFKVVGLAAGGNLELLKKQIHLFKPQVVSVATKQLAEELASCIDGSVAIHYGEAGLIEVACEPKTDMVVTAIMGSIGLKPTLAAIKEGKTIALANKETLVSAGHLVTASAKEKGVPILPIDSEHSAIFQCLNGESISSVAKLVLTASGGSFRDRSRDELQHVTVEEALRHPNWSMGAKITIDSATMVNKGLEVIEAHWLYDIPYEQIEVLLHPESIVHSYVQFVDNSIIAQMGDPDMRVPIQYALTYPDRWKSHTQPLDLAMVGKLHFQKMDFDRFRCLKLAFECGKIGGTAPTVFNAANEIAVDRFLRGEIQFLHIEEIIERTIEQHDVIQAPELTAIDEADRWARNIAREL